MWGQPSATFRGGAATAGSGAECELEPPQAPRAVARANHAARDCPGRLHGDLNEVMEPAPVRRRHERIAKPKATAARRDETRDLVLVVVVDDDVGAAHQVHLILLDDPQEPALKMSEPVPVVVLEPVAKAWRLVHQHNANGMVIRFQGLFEEGKLGLTSAVDIRFALLLVARGPVERLTIEGDEPSIAVGELVRVIERPPFDFKTVQRGGKRLSIRTTTNHSATSNSYNDSEARGAVAAGPTISPAERISRRCRPIARRQRVK